ncbi:MAG: hypothetical protein ACRDJW_16225 [Thermomicrobiales bacterium]
MFYHRSGRLLEKMDALPTNYAYTTVPGKIKPLLERLPKQAFIDFLEAKIASDGLVKLKQVRPNWGRFATIEDVRDEIGECQLVQVAKELGLLSKGEMKRLHGLSSTRNECAHPSAYRPTLNESLGYVSSLLTRLERSITKTL